MTKATVRLLAIALAVAGAGFATASHLGDPMSDTHAHKDATLHRLAEGGLDRVGWIDPPKDAILSAVAGPGFDIGLDDAGGAYFGEVDVRGDFAYLAQLKPPAGVHVIDISDPSHPTEVGVWHVGSGTGGITDVKVSLDGDFVYAAYQGSASDSQNGVFVLDVRDPGNPVTASHFSVSPSGVHMLFVWDAFGEEWVLAPTANGGGLPIALATDDLLTGKRTLRLVQTLNSGSSPHDVFVYDDAILGIPLLVVANANGGVQLQGFSVPAAPVFLGTWSQSGASPHYSHTVRATVVDGKRYVIVSPEGGALGYGVEEVAKLWVLDATNPLLVTVAGSWGNPGNHVSNVFLHSTHNFQLVGDRVYLAHNHGGVWVLDFSAAPALHALAYYLPADHAQTSTPGGSLIQDAIPATWDVVLQEGVIYAADRAGGLYALHYAGDELGPGGPTSYG